MGGDETDRRHETEPGATLPSRRRAICVLAKEPRPGLAKTRLAASIGAEAAGELAAAFLRDTLVHARAFESASLFIAYAGRRSVFADLAPDAALVAQPDASFGERLDAAIRAPFDAGAEQVVVIGTDAPLLGARSLARAFAALEWSDVAIAPAVDGGYALLALERPESALFERIDWSTGRVFGQTLERAGEVGLTVSELAQELDVDELDDLGRLAAVLREDPAAASWTTLALERLDLDL